ncbi:MAG: hypothetical protein LQ340_002773 [Diploschistes diacapsis]|nr:MAG: hypothetical protein LQ340_002773 [Diploschistes diacapsis]
MYALFTAIALLGACVSNSVAQSGGSNSQYSNLPGAASTTLAATANAITAYPDVSLILQAIAPSVTSVSPDQAFWIQADFEQFMGSYMADHPVPFILSVSPYELLNSNPTQTLDDQQLSSIEGLLSNPTFTPEDLSQLQSLLSGNPASSSIMAYASAADGYDSAAFSAFAPNLSNDLTNSAALSSFTAQLTPASASAALTGSGMDMPTTMATSTASSRGSSSSSSSSSSNTGGSTSNSVSTATTSGASSAGSFTSPSSTSTSGSSSRSSGLAAPTAGAHVVLSAVAAAAGIVGMAIL